MFGVGAVIGVILINFTATVIGKKTAICIAIGIACMHAYCLLFGAYLKNVILLVVSQSLGGFAHVALLVLGYLMLEKYGSPYIRNRISMTLTIFDIGLVPGVYSLIFPKWTAFVYLIVIMYSLLFVLSFFVLKEDPIHLFNTRQI